MATNSFEMFTERLRHVFSMAQEEATRLRHSYLGTEHLLLGLLRDTDSIGAKVLTALGIDLDGARKAVEAVVGQGNEAPTGEIGLTPRAKRVIEHAISEARYHQHTSIGTEHLLLGLLREGEGIAAGILESLGVNLSQARAEVLRTLNVADAPTQAEPLQSQDVRVIIVHATQIAREYNSQRPELAHLLLAILDRSESQEVHLLRQHGLRVEEARQALVNVLVHQHT